MSDKKAAYQLGLELAVKTAAASPSMRTAILTLLPTLIGAAGGAGYGLLEGEGNTAPYAGAGALAGLGSGLGTVLGERLFTLPFVRANRERAGLLASIAGLPGRLGETAGKELGALEAGAKLRANIGGGALGAVGGYAGLEGGKALLGIENENL